MSSSSQTETPKVASPTPSTQIRSPSCGGGAYVAFPECQPGGGGSRREGGREGGGRGRGLGAEWSRAEELRGQGAEQEGSAGKGQGRLSPVSAEWREQRFRWSSQRLILRTKYITSNCPPSPGTGGAGEPQSVLCPPSLEGDLRMPKS